MARSPPFRGTLGLIALLSQVRREAAIPVLAAGGIGSARALAAVLAAGAAGARCGTRTVAARESGAHLVYVEALVRAHAEDSVRTTLYHVGCPLCLSTHGVLKSAIDAAHALPGDAAGEIQMRGQQFPIPKFQGVPTPIKAMSGHIEAVCCYAGQSAGDVHQVRPAVQIIRELTDGVANACSEPDEARPRLRVFATSACTPTRKRSPSTSAPQGDSELARQDFPYRPESAVE
jgi:NAD(P)H-dependent flavin oxidoreductase YrpB (nitropropane dioxygenase family)